MSLDRRQLLTASAALLTSAATARPSLGAEDGSFTGERTEDWVDLKAPDGRSVLRYQRELPAEGEKRASVSGGCYVHPLYTPEGDLVTDLAPSDHPHHRGIFCGWVALEGERRGDWWGWGAKAPKEGRWLLNREARMTEESPEGATLRVINSWRARDAAPMEGMEPEEMTVVGERLTLSVSRVGNANVVDFEYKLTTPTRKPVVIEASPFGGFCYRARPRGGQMVTGPDGEVKLKDAVYNQAEANWPAAKWYDLSYRNAEDRVTGVAVLDHPKNPPSTWHVVRGIHMLNPCIVAGGAVTIPFGEPLYLRYRLVAHDGLPDPAALNALHEAFAERE